MALAEMKGKIERTDASEPVRMPLAERTQRTAALKKRLVGVHWSVDIEPSHKLQDLVAQMVSDQTLLWIPWDRLTSRAMEITADKTDSLVQFDSSGILKVVKKQQDATCSGTGEYAVRLALQRRSLAFELGQLCRYEHLEEWHEMILQIHMRVQPPGLQRVTMGQLREADKVLFTKISEETRGALSIPFRWNLPLRSFVGQVEGPHASAIPSCACGVRSLFKFHRPSEGLGQQKEDAAKHSGARKKEPEGQRQDKRQGKGW